MSGCTSKISKMSIPPQTIVNNYVMWKSVAPFNKKQSIM